MRTAARAISIVFHPLLLATWIVLLFGSLNKYAFGNAEVHKMAVIVFFNTFFFPAFTLFLMYVLEFIPDLQMRKKKDRNIPFIAAQIFYIWSFMVVKQLQMPVFLQLFILGATISISLAFIVNIFYKVSLHMVGMGAVVMLMVLVVFTGAIDVGHILPALILLTGLIGTARLIEKAHTLGELYYGFLVGLIGPMAGMIAFSRSGML